jgi:hypothetical protein
MRTRAPIITAISSAFVLAAASTPALATDTPAAPAAQAAPSIVSLQSVLSKCADTTRPTSGFGPKSARSARRTGVLRGSASDTGCGVAMVTVSVARVHGKQCQPVTSKGRLGRVGRCTAGNFLVAAGTSDWRLPLPKGLPRGTYLIRSRAIDFAGNVQQVRTRRLKLG